MKVKEIMKTLDSDDEFPDEYNESCTKPDYLNEWRFDTIQFKWIDKFSNSSNIDPSTQLNKEPSNIDCSTQQTYQLNKEPCNIDSSTQLSKEPSNIDSSSQYNKDIKQNKNLTEITKTHKCVIIRGVMNKQDLFCLKIIAITCPKILIWFTNYTIYKDLQSPYKFLQSCLVTV